jgi:hypothetical protein
MQRAVRKPCFGGCLNKLLEEDGASRTEEKSDARDLETEKLEHSTLNGYLICTTDPDNCRLSNPVQV